ncbi:serine/threonine-protein kinase [Actinomadura scrupuli]|uniref:serine/threonine-protein kinase n=1 Tax=Actinomadura scrupuli TaxID=559629 RepID=UPI003D952301
MAEQVPPEARPLLLEDPATIGDYRVLGRLGYGGMGAVYLAADATGAADAAGPGPGGGAGPMVAIKTLHPWLADDEASRSRFRAERDFGRRVSSFCIPRVLDDDMDGPRPYIVTEFVRGLSLAEHVRSGGPLTGDSLEAVAITVAAALLAIHTAGLAHRDLKPANVLLSPDGPKVIDFSIASDLESTDRLTQTNVVMGSPGWIAPERLTGGPGSYASDVFGWGCVVAFAATGLPPFGSGTALERTALILGGRPELDGLPGPWRRLVTSALAQDPDARPDADELLRTLLASRGPSAHPHGAADVITTLWTLPAPPPRSAAEPPSGPSPAPPPETVPAAPSGRRNTVTAWAVTAVAVTVAMAATVGGTGAPPSPEGSATGIPGSKRSPAASAGTSRSPAVPARSPAHGPTDPIQEATGARVPPPKAAKEKAKTKKPKGPKNSHGDGP